MRTSGKTGTFLLAALLLFCPLPSSIAQPDQPRATPVPSEHDLLQRVDSANENRYDNIAAFTDTEHYAVFRGNDETHPAAEMTVKMSYRKGEGKTYQIVSQSGSAIIQKFGLEPLLQNEKQINNPAIVKDSWFSSSNYDMKMKNGEIKTLDGIQCVAFAITPRRKAPNMIDGTLWVDPADGAIAEVDGLASRNPSIFAGTTRMLRDYTRIDSFSMAAHARAESHNAIFGKTVVTIDYSDYQVETVADAKPKQ